MIARMNYRCPYCGSKNLIPVNPWSSRCLDCNKDFNDDDVIEMLEEHISNDQILEALKDSDKREENIKYISYLTDITDPRD